MATSKFCEYCGKKGHATNKHKKCRAALQCPKKYKDDNGSLLVLALPLVLDDDNDDFVLPTSIR
jgi:hypothetical protein